MRTLLFGFLLAAALSGCANSQKHDKEISQYISEHPALDINVQDGLRKGQPVTGMTLKELCLILDLNYESRDRYGWGRFVKTGDGEEVWAFGNTFYNFQDGKLTGWAKFGPNFGSK